MAESYSLVHSPELVTSLLDDLVVRVLARIKELHEREEKVGKRKRLGQATVHG